jgi:hypothetical protein
MAKGEMQFTTIALLVITAVVLIAVIIWFLPSFSETGKSLTDVGDTVESDEIAEVKCASYCDANNTAAFCADDDCWNGSTEHYACLGIIPAENCV